MKIVFLGTSGSMPTQRRASSAIAIRRKGEVIIFDCGEGTQRRMVEAGIGFRRRTIIFVSHLHGDHVLGLPGLLQTMTLLKRERILGIYGPKGLVDFVQAFRKVIGGPGFPVEVYEIHSEGIIYRAEEYEVAAVEANHDVPAWSYVLNEKPRPGRFHPEKAKDIGVPVGPLWKSLQKGQDVKLSGGRIVRSEEVVDPPRRGFKIAYSGDTRPNSKLAEAAKGADLMIHEATFDGSLLERAEENGHSTASQAAEIAKDAEVRKLVLTHISSRYPDPTPLLEEAREIFPETEVAEDLLEIELR
ncbi:MAG: ribonuclease Z [Candidatus Bathyarchaeota archaeon]|jgi:ribonuclease Z